MANYNLCWYLDDAEENDEVITTNYELTEENISLKYYDDNAKKCSLMYNNTNELASYTFTSDIVKNGGDVSIDIVNNTIVIKNYSSDLALVYNASLTKIANAIRSLNGSTNSYTPLEMSDAIKNLVSGTQDITENGTYDVANKEKVNVNIESGASLLDITAKFKVEDSDYEIVSIKTGNQILKPFINPSITGKVFQGWFDSASGGNEVSFPYSPSEDVDFYAHMVEGKTMTVTGLGNSAPTTVTFDVPSDFKFTDGEYVDDSGNVFVKIPKMYRKVNAITNNQITSFSISNVKVDDNYKIYPVFLAEDGVTELDWVGIGKYMSKNSNKVDSVASGSVVGMGLGNARENIKSNYSYGRYQLYDWMFHKLWQDLIIMKMQTVNTNSGSGIQTDQLGIYWSSASQWIDGFGHVNNYVYLCDKPSKYVDSPTDSTDGYFTTNYRILTTSSGIEISKLGYDEMHPFVNLPTAGVSNSSYNTYYCDVYWYSSGNRPFCCGVGYGGASCGAFDLYGYDGWSTTHGVRLCYRPIA